MITLEEIAQSSAFAEADKSSRAEMLLWQIYSKQGRREGVELGAISDAFHELDLVRPKSIRLREQFKKSRNVRTIAKDVYAPTRAFSELMEKRHKQIPINDELIVEEIELPPFISSERRNDLKLMVQTYARLFLLENSMRGLIEAKLEGALGKDWWQQAANSKMRKKHSDRLDNERSRKWAPTRSSFGPLYSLDWPDLLTIMRKYPEHFQPVLGDLNFLHRFDDAGAFRNVVAHNGALRDADDLKRIEIYYRDWVHQLK